MGTSPPEDRPPPAEQDIVTGDAGFAPGPTSTSLCGFKFPPIFRFKFGFNLPAISLPLPISFTFSIGINCNLDNPFDVSAGVKYGGGRVSSGPRDPDEADREEYLSK